ncbi:MAG: class I SAM-dependent methyltransferase [Alphaproteobacteria bacterium]|nr:class I SAM-dependent methyltransferase [Alphaproteobacteria bacterium]HPF45472.1 class I SAM-dependent methyltransferase [Emcibacteraceae bacterium]HRW29756.1 class I SAM-dependent methyltransferase [Emcibacteraceae bacterium]
MFQDVVDLNTFYSSPLGKITTRLIRNQIRSLWPSVKGMDIMGLGYAVPYLEPFRDEANHIAAIMPTLQGVMRWPRFRENIKDEYGRYQGNLAALARETDLPIKEASMDRVIMVHCLEHTDHSKQLLREIWRSLAPGGKILIIVPSRLGPWCRSEATPFGHGIPFSTEQIKKILINNMLTPTRWTSALFLPPFKSRTMLMALATLESTGQRWWSQFAGVLIIEAEKQIYAANTKQSQKQVVAQPAMVGSPMSHHE